MGSAFVRDLARQGAKVVVTNIPGMDVACLVAEIRDAGGEALGHEGDIRSQADISTMVESANRSFGSIDILVSNAAAIGQMGGDRDLESMTMGYRDDVMAINVRGAMLYARQVMPRMQAQRSGVIINFGSTAALMGDQGLIAYFTTKAALLGFNRAVATTLQQGGNSLQYDLSRQCLQQ